MTGPSEETRPSEETGPSDETRPAPAPGLDAHLVVTRDAFRLDVQLTAAPGEVVALLGPNGAGKSTALRALAGLTPLGAGHTRLAGVDLEDPKRRLYTPPERRPVGVVFQDYLLFPHLSALENVAFGLRCQGVGRREARSLAADWLDRVGLAEHAGVKPGRLSGGQAQRVALARALATHPRLLLLDEPLAALDARTRVAVRATLRRHLADFDGVAVVITHDPLDAMVLADRLTVIEAGRAVQSGTPAEVARHPRTDYVARLVGLNLYRGSTSAGGVDLPAGQRLVVAELPDADEVFVAFPPAAVTLYRTRPDGSPRNLWQVEVDGMELHGDTVRVELTGPVPLLADVTPLAVAELELAPGKPVWAAVKATEARAYPA
ncbi:ABC transporter ATP-binding protein [Embleya sp. NPDC005971]|uniref:ABC transporter ATP-binding protein n=1 Tax=Embleya sp. NPDC005971 TaxID=3156724 RepID=UPI0033E6C6EB